VITRCPSRDQGVDLARVGELAHQGNGGPWRDCVLACPAVVLKWVFFRVWPEMNGHG
jgi:hypothetical protein